MLWTLLIAFLVKHFLADFPLQTAYMLGKSKRAGWAVPLLAHSTVHGALTLAGAGIRRSRRSGGRSAPINWRTGSATWQSFGR